MEEPIHAADRAASPTPLSAMLSDPALLGRLTSLLANMQNAPPVTNTEAHSDPPSHTLPPALPSTDALASVLSDPAILEMLPKIMSALAPALAVSAPPSEQALPTVAKKHDPTHDRDNLLLAIKPFLSAERRDAVDTLLRIARLGEVFKQIK